MGIKFNKKKIIFLDLIFSLYFFGLTIWYIISAVKNYKSFVEVELVWFCSIIPIQIIFIMLELAILLIFFINGNMNLYIRLLKIQFIYHFLNTLYSFFIIIVISEQIEIDNISFRLILTNCLSNFLYLVLIFCPKVHLHCSVEFFLKICTLSTESNIKLNNGSIININNIMECSICIEQYPVGCDIAIMNCDHFFHKNCIIEWLNRKPTCPICREEV